MLAHHPISFKQKLTFCILWLAYGSTYLLRKPFGFLKEQIKVEYNLAESSLGYIDFAFLLPYALVSLAIGGMVDRMGPHFTLSVGLVGSAFSTLLMFFARDFVSFIILLALSGTFQAVCWPACCTILSSWFSKTSKATLFGYYGTNIFVWSLLGSFLPVIIELINKDYKMWKSTYLVSSSFVLVMSLIVILFVRLLKNTNNPNPMESPSSLRALFLPCVKEIAFVMFFVKSVRYSFMFWLPYYLVENLGYTAIAGGITSASFDVGGIIGSASIGLIIERYMKGKEMKTCIYSILGSIVALVLFFLLNFDGVFGWVIDILWLTFAGALNCGPDVILTGSLAAKIGELHGIPSGVTSIVNGMGSLGTVIEGPLVAYVVHYFGIQSILPLMIFFSIMALYFASKAQRVLIQEKNVMSLPNFT